MNIGKTLVASAVAGLVLGAVACGGGENKDPATSATSSDTSATSGSATPATSAAAPAGSAKGSCGAK